MFAWQISAASEGYAKVILGDSVPGTPAPRPANTEKQHATGVAAT